MDIPYLYGARNCPVCGEPCRHLLMIRGTAGCCECLPRAFLGEGATKEQRTEWWDAVWWGRGHVRIFLPPPENV